MNITMDYTPYCRKVDSLGYILDRITPFSWFTGIQGNRFR